MTLNSNTADSVVTLPNAGALVGAATGNKVTVGGSKALTIAGDLDAVQGLTIEKAAGAGTVTLKSTDTLASTDFSKAAVDVLDVTVATASNLKVNENTTLKFSIDNGSRAY